jgi:hypothetical protein
MPPWIKRVTNRSVVFEPRRLNSLRPGQREQQGRRI